MDGPLVSTPRNDVALDTPTTPHGRRDSYRLLARRAAQHAELAQRRTGAHRCVASRAAARTNSFPSPLTSLPKPNGYWAADVQIRCFGRFELSRHGVAVQRWRRRSAERLLKFLLVNGRRVHRDVLLDMLWPDVPNNSSIRGLRVTLHALRRAVAQVAPGS